MGTNVNLGSSDSSVSRIALPSGGTTGQFLRKSSDENYEAEWTDSSASVNSINDVLDVDATTATDGQILKYNETTSTWEAVDDTGGSGSVDLSDYYNKTETDTLLSDKANSSTLSLYYNKTEITGLLNDKADVTDLSNYSESDHTHSYSYALDDLTDTNIGTPLDGYVLKYDSTTSKWIPAIDLSGTGGSSDHGGLTGLTDDDHLQYHDDTRGDLRYYTKSQIDSSLLDYADVSHTHTGYSLDTHEHDADYADVAHTHTGYSSDTHNHDSDYAELSHNHDSDYAELNHSHSGYSLDSHNHDLDYAGLTHNHSITDVTGLQTALDTKLESIDELSEVVDVSTTAPTDGQVLTWNDGDGEWTPTTPSAGGGSSAWGGITGTLSAQTDLQTALDTKLESIDELSEVVDVSTTIPTDGQVLTWNDGDGEWAPTTPASGGGGSAPQYIRVGRKSTQYTINSTGIFDILCNEVIHDDTGTVYFDTYGYTIIPAGTYEYTYSMFVHLTSSSYYEGYCELFYYNPTEGSVVVPGSNVLIYGNDYGRQWITVSGSFTTSENGTKMSMRVRRNTSQSFYVGSGVFMTTAPYVFYTDLKKVA